MPEATPVVVPTKTDPSDPTARTTEQLWREIGHLKELIVSRVESVDKAVQVAHDDLVRVPTEVQRAVSALKELHEKEFGQKFETVKREFAAYAHL